MDWADEEMIELKVPLRFVVGYRDSAGPILPPYVRGNAQKHYERGDVAGALHAACRAAALKVDLPYKPKIGDKVITINGHQGTVIGVHGGWAWIDFPAYPSPKTCQTEHLKPYTEEGA